MLRIALIPAYLELNPLTRVDIFLKSLHTGIGAMLRIALIPAYLEESPYGVNTKKNNDLELRSLLPIYIFVFITNQVMLSLLGLFLRLRRLLRRNLREKR